MDSCRSRTRLIQIDIEPYELGRNWEPDVAIQADARHAIKALGQALSERGIRPNGTYVPWIEAGRAEAIAAAAADAEAALDSGAMPLKGKVDRPRDQSCLRREHGAG